MSTGKGRRAKGLPAPTPTTSDMIKLRKERGKEEERKIEEIKLPRRERKNIRRGEKYEKVSKGVLGPIKESDVSNKGC